eukprot:3868733-Amphidinium_carterae.1
MLAAVLHPCKCSSPCGVKLGTPLGVFAHPNMVKSILAPMLGSEGVNVSVCQVEARTNYPRAT